MGLSPYPYFVSNTNAKRCQAVASARGRARQGSAGGRAVSYAALFLLLLWQALCGRGLVAPDATGLASLAIWTGVTLLVLGGIAVGKVADSSRRRFLWHTVSR
jgi:hypothetical protein